MRTEAVREIFETVDFHGGRPWTVEVAIWDLVGRLLGQPLWRLLGGRSERLLAYASTAEPVAAEERARRVAALRDRGVRAVKLRFHHDDWRRDVEVVEQVRAAVGPDVEIMVDANQGWRMAGDRSARWDVATATPVRPRARAARRLLARGAAADRRRRGLRAAAPPHVAAHRGRRDGAQPVRGARPHPARRRRRGAARRGARRRPRRLPADRRARGPVRPRVLAAHVDERLRPAREPAPRGRGVDLPVHRGAVRPAGLDAGPARLAARRAHDRDRADGTIAPPPGPGLGVVPDLDRLEEHRVA